MIIAEELLSLSHGGFRTLDPNNYFDNNGVYFRFMYSEIKERNDVLEIRRTNYSMSYQSINNDGLAK